MSMGLGLNMGMGTSMSMSMGMCTNLKATHMSTKTTPTKRTTEARFTPG